MKARPAPPPCRPCGRVRAACVRLWQRRHLLLAALLAALLPVAPGNPGALAVGTPAGAAVNASANANANANAEPVARAASAALAAANAATLAATLAASAANAAAAAAQAVANASRQRSGQPQAAAASAPELIHTRLVLVRLVQDQDWKGMPLVHYGRPPYTTLEYDEDALPPGMSINPEGVLVGTPTKAKAYDFVLRLVAPGRTTEQRYRIVVSPAPGPPRAAAPAPMTSMPAAQASRSADTTPNLARTYRLSKAELDELMRSSEKAATRAAQREEDGLPLAVPTAKQMEEILLPLEDVEFPTEALLRHALLASSCRYYKVHVEKVAAELKREVDSTCPPQRSAPIAAMPWEAWLAAAAASGSAASTPARLAQAARRAVSAPRPAASAPARSRLATVPTDIELRQFFDDLLTHPFRDEIVAKAEKLHRLPQQVALELEGTRGCGCTPANPIDEVYGFLGYWHAKPESAEKPEQPEKTEKPKPPEAQPVNLGLYTRLSYLGASLERDGNIVPAYAGLPHALRFVREAQRHGTQVDLAIQRRDWRFLDKLNAEQFDTFVARAATEAVRLLETPLNDATAAWQSLLIPPWREPNFAYAGLTLFFDDLGTTDAERAQFRKFMHAFVPTLMATMRRKALPGIRAPQAAPARPDSQAARGDAAPRVAEPQRTPRPYRLNIVVPDRVVLQDTGYVDWMWEVLSVAESVLTEDEVKLRRKALYRNTANLVAQGPDITVQFLVLLSEPTTDFKKWLRTGLDASKSVTGHDRVALLESLVPVLLHKREGAVGSLAPKPRKQLDEDFAYAKWNFGGVGVWPLPVANRGHGKDVDKLLGPTYWPADGWGATVCKYICPWRLPLRLLLQMLLLVGAVSISLYVWNCEVRKIGRPYKVFLLLGALATAGVALALLSCDPEMESWRRANAFLYAVIALLFVLGAYFVLKPKEALP